MSPNQEMQKSKCQLLVYGNSEIKMSKSFKFLNKPIKTSNDYSIFFLTFIDTSF